MKILFVTNTYPTVTDPGLTPCIKEQKDALECEGIQVDILYIEGKYSILKYLKGAISVFLKSMKKKYDIIHAHFGFTGISAVAGMRAPLIITLRGSDVLRVPQRQISKIGIHFANKIIVMTKEMSTLIDNKDVRILPYGINLELFKPLDMGEARKELNFDKDENLVLFPYDPARKEKGYRKLVKAIDTTSEKIGQKIRIVTVYDQPYELMPVYMNACNVLVLTSHYEGSPLAIREAMACNLPIISFDVGDVAETINNVRACYICSESLDDLAEKIGLVLIARERSNGREYVVDMNSRKIAKQLLNIYKDTIGFSESTKGGKL